MNRFNVGDRVIVTNVYQHDETDDCFADELENIGKIFTVYGIELEDEMMYRCAEGPGGDPEQNKFLSHYFYDDEIASADHLPIVVLGVGFVDVHIKKPRHGEMVLVHSKQSIEYLKDRNYPLSVVDLCMYNENKKSFHRRNSYFSYCLSDYEPGTLFWCPVPVTVIADGALIFHDYTA